MQPWGGGDGVAQRKVVVEWKLKMEPCMVCNQSSLIRITLMRGRIQIGSRIKVKSQTRIRIKVKVGYGPYGSESKLKEGSGFESASASR
jgi:hypothetical protein